MLLLVMEIHLGLYKQCPLCDMAKGITSQLLLDTLTPVACVHAEFLISRWKWYTAKEQTKRDATTPSDPIVLCTVAMDVLFLLY